MYVTIHRVNNVPRFSVPVKSAGGRVSPLRGVAISLKFLRCAVVKILM